MKRRLPTSHHLSDHYDSGHARQTGPRTGHKIIAIFSTVVMSVVVVASLSLIVLWQWQRQFEANQPTQTIVLLPQDVENKGPAKVIHYDATTRELRFFVVPAELPLTLVGGFGEYPVRSAVSVIRQQQPDPALQERQLKSSLSFELQLVVERVWYYQGDAQDSVAALLTANQVSSSDLSGFQRWQWWWWLQGAEQAQGDNQIANWAEIAEHQKWVSEPLIKGCPVALVNTTTRSGLASMTSAVLEKSGVHVVRLTDTDQKLAETAVISRVDAASDSECQAVLERLKSVIPTVWQVTADQRQADQFRAELVVLLGENFASQLPVTEPQ